MILYTFSDFRSYHFIMIGKHNKAECRCNVVHTMVLHIPLQEARQNINQSEAESWLASYGIFVVNILEKICCVITEPHSSISVVWLCTSAAVMSQRRKASNKEKRLCFKPCSDYFFIFDDHIRNIMVSQQSVILWLSAKHIRHDFVIIIKNPGAPTMA